MKFPAGLPPSLRGLWKKQYAPRERILVSRLKSGDAKKRYFALSYVKKIQVIDTLERYGDFKR